MSWNTRVNTSLGRSKQKNPKRKAMANGITKRIYIGSSNASLRARANIACTTIIYLIVQWSFEPLWFDLLPVPLVFGVVGFYTGRLEQGAILTSVLPGFAPGTMASWAAVFGVEAVLGQPAFLRSGDADMSQGSVAEQRAEVASRMRVMTIMRMRHLIATVYRCLQSKSRRCRSRA